MKFWEIIAASTNFPEVPSGRGAEFSSAMMPRPGGSFTPTDQKELYDGAPVGLQVMGKRHEEEKVLGLMEAISVALQEYQLRQENYLASSN